MTRTHLNLVAFRDMEASKPKDSNKGQSNSTSTPNNESTQLHEAGPSTNHSQHKSKNKGKQKIVFLSPVKMKAKVRRQPNANGTRKTAMA